MFLVAYMTVSLLSCSGQVASLLMISLISSCFMYWLTESLYSQAMSPKRLTISLSFSYVWDELTEVGRNCLSAALIRNSRIVGMWFRSITMSFSAISSIEQIIWVKLSIREEWILIWKVKSSASCLFSQVTDQFAI